MTNTAGTPISADEAWFTFHIWEMKGSSVGFLLTGKTTTVGARGKVVPGREGTLQLLGETSRAVFKLAEAVFTRGPVNVYPCWPSPSRMEIGAIQVHLKTGEYLVLAEESEEEWSSFGQSPN